MREAATPSHYRALGLAALIPSAKSPGRILLPLAWLVSLLFSIALGLMSITHEWSGIPIQFGGLEIFITIYPPLILSTLWVLWFGFWWGFIPAYLATLVLALYSGMPVGWSLLFAFADPLSLAVLALAYRAVPIGYDLRTLIALAFFVLISFVGSIFGATGSFIWTHTNNLGMHALLPIWEGWWLGGLLQNLLLVAPLLYLFSAPVARWRDRRFGISDGRQRETRATLLAVAVVILGVLAYLYFTISFSNSRLDAALALEDSTASHAAIETYTETTAMLFWVVVILILFITFFGAQLFVHWTRSLQQSARELTNTNIQLRQEIAQREQVEQDLHETAGRLATANASKDRLFSIVSHDLRGPVGSIVSLLGILDSRVRQFGNRELSGHFGDLQTAMQQLMRFLENLLQWSRLQLKQDQFHPASCALEQMLEQARDPCQLHASMKSIEIRQQIPAAMHAWADPHMLQTILHNLLSNAIKFTPEGGRITIQAIDHGKETQILIADSGAGIEAERLAHLFDIARIESRPGTCNEQGNGMGLLLCKELVERHGGRLWVESQMDQGTRVYFTLPSQ